MQQHGPLKRFRLANDMRLDAMAAALGVHKSTLGRIDRRKQTPSREFCDRVFQFTNGQVTPNDFFDLAQEVAA